MDNKMIELKCDAEFRINDSTLAVNPGITMRCTKIIDSDLFEIRSAYLICKNDFIKLRTQVRDIDNDELNEEPYVYGAASVYNGYYEEQFAGIHFDTVNNTAHIVLPVTLINIISDEQFEVDIKLITSIENNYTVKSYLTALENYGQFTDTITNAADEFMNSVKSLVK